MGILNSVTMLAIIPAGARVVRERGTAENLLVMPVTPSETAPAKVWSRRSSVPPRRFGSERRRTCSSRRRSAGSWAPSRARCRSSACSPSWSTCRLPCLDLDHRPGVAHAVTCAASQETVHARRGGERPGRDGRSVARIPVASAPGPDGFTALDGPMGGLPSRAADPGWMLHLIGEGATGPGRDPASTGTATRRRTRQVA